MDYAYVTMFKSLQRNSWGIAADIVRHIQARIRLNLILTRDAAETGLLFTIIIRFVCCFLPFTVTRSMLLHVIKTRRGGIITI